MLKVNIVIPTYNGLRFLDPLYQALKAGISEQINYKITIVDDGSIDSTQKWADQHPDINYLKQPANLGFAKACNRGAKSLDAEYILFLNNDTQPQKGFLGAMLKVAEENFAHPQIVGAKILLMNGETVQHAGIKFMASGYPYEFGQGKMANSPEVNKTGEMNAVTAAAMLFKKDLFDGLKGFDEEYINGWEDQDICLRARERGAKIFYCAEAVVLHHRFASEGRFTHEIENKNLFRDKWLHHRKINVLTPFWMAIAATWQCNLKCVNCGIWKRQSKEELDVFEFQKWISHDFFSNITNVCIFGGEPTLHPKLVELLAICADRWRGQEIGIVTNGYIIENQKKIWETVKNNLSTEFIVRVSIDGREEEHDRMRGRSGVFMDAIETAKFVNTLWPGKGGISITVYPDTVDELSYLIEFIEKLGITFCMRVGVSGSYFGGQVNEEWTPEKIDKFENILNSISDKFKAFDRFVHILPTYLRNNENRKLCEAYRKSLVVNTDLQTSICHELPPLGHLRDIPAIWGRTQEWCMAGYKCLTDECFKNSCFLDGPYSLSYIKD